MKSFFYWLLVAILLTALVHISLVLLIPRFQMQNVAEGITTVLPKNEIRRISPQMAAAVAGFRGLDPAFQYATCRFDVTDKAVELTLPVKSLPTDIVLYNDQLRAIYTTNDTSRFDNVLRVLLVTDRQILRLRENLPETAQKAQFFKLDEPVGTALIRVFAPRKSQSAEVDAMLDAASCKTFDDIDLG